MSQQQEVQQTINNQAVEQVLFLKNRYKMQPHEIVRLYTGEDIGRATYDDAIASIARFNSQNARKNGFVA